ncbi:MAG: glycosyltransferase family 4 protein [Actinomycetota bacterium]
MRVLQVARYGSVKGGAETYVAAVCEGLRSDGHEVVLAYGSDPDMERPEVETGYAIPALAGGDAIEGAPALDEAIEDFRPDVVHVHTADAAWVAPAVARRARVLLAVHDHRLDSPAGTKYWAAWRKPCTIRPGAWCLAFNVAGHCGSLRANASLRPYREWRAARAAVLGLHLQAFSEYMRGELVRAGLDLPIITVTPYPVPPPTPSLDPRDDDPRPVILASGRLNKEKGFRQLIEAVARVRTAAHLVIAGSGHERDALEKRARSVYGPHRITFTGWLSPEALEGWRARAAVIAVPSMWPEPFGIVGLEAMAAGRAVVAFDSGGIREWLTDDLNGRLVPTGDVRGFARALEELLGDESARARMGAAGRARAETEFSLAAHVEKLTTLYRAVGSR